MLAPNPKLSSDHPDHALTAHRARVEECKPLLDKSIPLGVPPMPPSECAAVERHFRAKHRRGDFGTYWPLHQVTTFTGRTSDFRKKAE